ncbi:hypothetical protein QIA34_00500 (plasmid) [Borreliella yangtzensis]|uniref:Surface lipoprotein P27 n=1 Tax=Borreliella yangtzensis TaxID=683292 RepID=A0ABR6PEZ3_9SPIR|nr:hypothetical protein [Borreliella yangtzensis]MBB6043286.1 hypothetical protein [Borreliella yangtzensis]WKC72994.1 hypothetical protein QIA35_00505 [Borreliella yangtzensis]WKC73913.1 hypothetical protein QIA34_00500 [Borreliella yangtzensis]
MVKRIILILLGFAILSCDLFTTKSPKNSRTVLEPKNPEQKTKEQKPAAKIIPTVSIQSVEIRQSNNIPTSIENYYKQAYPIQTFSIDFSINREKEFQQTEDKILSTQGVVASLSILIQQKLLDFKQPKNSTFKTFKEIQNIENFFQNQDLLFVLNLKPKNGKNIINIMLNPPNDIGKPKNHVLLGIKDIIKNGIGEQNLNPIYRFQIKNNKDYHSIDYNKISITENSVELDLLPHNQIFKLNKNFTQILEILTDINKLKSLIQKEYI